MKCIWLLDMGRVHSKIPSSVRLMNALGNGLPDVIGHTR